MVPEKEKPLMLKDYLALDESSNAGFQCYPRVANTGAPTVRHLLDAELSGFKGGALVRSTSKSRNTLNKLSSVIKFRFFQKQEGFLARSLSRKLKGSLWRRRWQGSNNECRMMRFDDEDMDRRSSFNYPSPVVSSFRSWLEIDNASEIFVPGTATANATESPPVTKDIGIGINGAVDTTDNKQKIDQEEQEDGGEYPMEQCLDVEKEQFSPVSVMDFPFDEEEEEEDDVTTTTTTTSSSPFHSSTTNNTERTELHNSQKSRRFDQIDELKPIDLEEEFNAAESRCYKLYNTDQNDTAWDLLLQLTLVENSDQLLLDFFIEGLSDKVQQTKLLNEARDWMNNAGWRWEMQGSRSVLEVQEMEKNGKWIGGFEREQPEVSIDLENIILGTLVQELVHDMLDR